MLLLLVVTGESWENQTTNELVAITVGLPIIEPRVVPQPSAVSAKRQVMTQVGVLRSHFHPLIADTLQQDKVSVIPTATPVSPVRRVLLIIVTGTTRGIPLSNSSRGWVDFESHWTNWVVGASLPVR